jgi:ribosomal-protein-alanine N-acetyltransferase
MNPWTMRDLERGDIARILEIERASFLTPWTEEMFRTQLRFRDRAVTLVLVEDGVVTGYIAAWIAADEMHLLSIAVSPAERRGGRGSALLAALLERGSARGCAKVLLEVREGNEGARRLYRLYGFREIGKRRGYYADTGEDAIIMERRSGE